MPRPQSQLNLPVTEVVNRSNQSPAVTERTNRERDASGEPAGTNDSDVDAIVVKASLLFHQALHDARVTSAEAAHLMKVSENYVNRMRSPNYRECVSLVQLLRCGPVVVYKFHVALHHKEQFGQRALREAMQALSLLAVGIE